MKPVRYDWTVTPDDLDLRSVADLLDAYEDGKLNGGFVMDALRLGSQQELRQVMDLNGRVMPCDRPVPLTDDLMTVLAADCGREWVPKTKRVRPAARAKPGAQAAE
jgi:hypothetical protein